MGRDKASLPARPPSPPVGPAAADRPAVGTLAERTAAILARHCSPVIEVGPGHTPLTAVTETPPGGGPLVAIAAGWAALRSSGWHGPVVVVATDMPNLTDAMVGWLTGHEETRSVVPVAVGRVQPLCARYSPADLDLAEELVAGGKRAMGALLDASDPELVAEEQWAAAAGGAEVLADVDTPEDLLRETEP